MVYMKEFAGLHEALQPVFGNDSPFLLQNFVTPQRQVKKRELVIINQMNMCKKMCSDRISPTIWELPSIS